MPSTIARIYQDAPASEIMYPTETEITNCHTGDKTSRTPPVRGAIFQRQVVSPQLRKKMTEEKTMSGDRARGRGPVARCLYEQLLTNGTMQIGRDIRKQVDIFRYLKYF